MESVQCLCRNMEMLTACELLGISRSTYYFWVANKDYRQSKPRKQYTADHTLTAIEKEAILTLMTSNEYMDKTPYEIFYSELDHGHYYCSIRSMYRILKEKEMVAERRRGHRRTHYSKPELLATDPNQVWSWDITKLKGPRKWMFYYLYVILDIYSRYVVGWLLAHRESAQLARELIEQTCARQQIQENQLIIHSDNGASMTSNSVSRLLDNLQVSKSLNRPGVSNDNPFSESQFKTMKYRPEFPERFGSIEDARTFCRQYFGWYNNEHYHSGLNYLTPYAMHYGLGNDLLIRRQNAMNRAYEHFPKRFRNGQPAITGPPERVWINKPESDNEIKQKLTLVVSKTS